MCKVLEGIIEVRKLILLLLLPSVTGLGLVLTQSPIVEKRSTSGEPKASISGGHNLSSALISAPQRTFNVKFLDTIRLSMYWHREIPRQHIEVLDEGIRKMRKRGQHEPR